KRESTSKENWIPEPPPVDPGESPRPTYERLENYEVFEERKTKWMDNHTTQEPNHGNNE
ncbi:MAG: hypothetical protein ThorAB25_19400, partial [Candidatus Thorarchaeota archaeon AB_25]